MTPDYILPLREKFETNANIEEAIPMKKYMKNKFDFFGIKSPLRKDIYKDFKNKYGLLPDENFEEIIKWCWKQNEREYQYFAMEFLSKRMKKSTLEIIDLFEFMIVEKSWWDTVDFIAAVLVGDYFKRFPGEIKRITEKWMNSGNIWLQRSCLLFQLKYKNKTDVELMEYFIVRLLGSKEFFINKAIGWILREYSKTKPQVVVNIVERHSLSGLSNREALKWMQNKGLV